MRKITDHIANPVNDRIEITAQGDIGRGGENVNYLVEVPDDDACTVDIYFQNGPIAEVGVNGVTNEVLLAIVIDRLRSLQAGPFKCDDNDYALFAAEDALHWLKERTRDRMERGVEGTSAA